MAVDWGSLTGVQQAEMMGFLVSVEELVALLDRELSEPSTAQVTLSRDEAIIAIGCAKAALDALRAGAVKK